MNRIEIKESAKAKIKGNIWNLIWPYLCIIVISGISSRFSGGVTYDVNTMQYVNNTSTTGTIISIIINLIVVVLSVGYLKYVLDFIRTGELNINKTIDTIKEKWLKILITSIISGIIIAIGYLLLIVPGIILALSFSMMSFILIDSDLSGMDVLKKSKEMKNGYKMDYFIFNLSFVGWFILGIFTCCILYIWVLPYYFVATALYYEKLKEKVK